VQVAEVKTLACQLPAETEVPLSRWSCPDLATEAVTRGLVPTIFASTIRRILATDLIKPWQYQSWIFIRDPDFAAKATQVLDLYAAPIKVSRSARTNTSSPATRRPASRHAAAAIPPWHRVPPG
jgi:hypothetical protein